MASEHKLFKVCSLSLAMAAFLPGAAFAALQAPGQPQVPTLSYDDHSAVITWDAPADISQIADYQVIQNGQVVATAKANNQEHAASAPYIKKFYEENNDGFAQPIVWQSATITGLAPNKTYQFQVRAVGKDGELSDLSSPVSVTTAATPTTVSVVNYGAVGDGKTNNTDALQKAIDACPTNCKLVVPAGTYVTGALFLKSNMTLDLEKDAVLLGSTDPADYPDGYHLYPYSQTMRPASLINAIKRSTREPGTYTNIRIVGEGVIDGHGWKQASESYKDTLGNSMPHYLHSSRNHYAEDGILAKAQVDRAVNGGMDLHTAYGQMRSSLVTLRGVENLYIGGVTIRNPAYHGVMVLMSKNVAVNGLKAITYDANNGDGIELGNTQNAMVFNSYFDTGDDSINFAAGTGKLAGEAPRDEHVKLFNNFFHHGHGAVVMGSHTGAGMHDIVAENSVADGSNIGLRIKSSTIIGGGVDNVKFRNFALKDTVNNALTITLKYSDPNASIDYPVATDPVSIHDITMSNVSVDGLTDDDASLNIQGESQHQTWYHNVTLNNIKLRNVNPAYIEDLDMAHFNHVSFSNVTGGSDPWSFHHVKNVWVDNHQVSEDQ